MSIQQISEFEDILKDFGTPDAKRASWLRFYCSDGTLNMLKSKSKEDLYIMFGSEIGSVLAVALPCQTSTPGSSGIPPQIIPANPA